MAQLQLTWTRLVSLPGGTYLDEPLVGGVKMMVITLRLLTSFQEDQGAQEGESASSPTAIQPTPQKERWDEEQVKDGGKPRFQSGGAGEDLRSGGEEEKVEGGSSKGKSQGPAGGGEGADGGGEPGEQVGVWSF